MEKDLVMNSEFRIKWPRGLLGVAYPADSEQFMLIEELYKQTRQNCRTRVDGMLHNEVMILIFR